MGHGMSEAFSEAQTEMGQILTTAKERGPPGEFDATMLKPDWEATLSQVQDDVNMAFFFVGIAKHMNPAIGPRWGINLAAMALWSALDILNDKVMSEKFVASSTAWFEDNEPLVNLLRHGAVHARQRTGMGQSFSPGGPKPQVRTFLWIDRPGSESEQIPWVDALQRLVVAAHLVAQTALQETKTRVWTIATS
jgi:hypothetical protein